MSNNYHFTNSWFESTAKNNWDFLLPQIKPTRILEIGSFEGASSCYLINNITPHNPLELHCIDTWEGGNEHQSHGVARADMHSVEERFDHNTNLAIKNATRPVDFHKHKCFSDKGLIQLLTEKGTGYFDFIYIDGSHQAPDVLCDAVLAFKLIKIGGIIAFDDYIWSEYQPPYRDILACPKPAVDAFVNIHYNKINVMNAYVYQIYIQKLLD